MDPFEEVSEQFNANDGVVSIDDLLAPLQAYLSGIQEQLEGINKRIDMLGAQSDWLVQQTSQAFAAIQQMSSGGMMAKMMAGLKGGTGSE